MRSRSRSCWSLLIRRVTPRWLLTAVIGIGAGAIIGVGAFLIANALNAFGSPLPLEVGLWAGATLAGVGLAVVSLWDQPGVAQDRRGSRDRLAADHRR